jgi:hypothetical protein
MSKQSKKTWDHKTYQWLRDGEKVVVTKEPNRTPNGFKTALVKAVRTIVKKGTLTKSHLLREMCKVGYEVDESELQWNTHKKEVLDTELAGEAGEDLAFFCDKTDEEMKAMRDTLENNLPDRPAVATRVRTAKSANEAYRKQQLSSIIKAGSAKGATTAEKEKAKKAKARMKARGWDKK